MVNFYNKTFTSRLLIGSALYPSPAIMQDAIGASGAQIVTVSLRRESAGGKTGDAFWKLIRELDVTVLPNTAGCRSVREAVTTAELARELFGTSWIKLEVIADNDTLQPDVVDLVEAASILIKDGFEVFPYCTEDLSVASRLVDAGCKVVMPWAAPIGSAKGITNRDALKLLRDRLPDITLVVDAGIGAPSHAAQALELGYDARAAQHRNRQGRRPRRHGQRLPPRYRGGTHSLRGRADERARFRFSLHPCRWDTILACGILIASIPSSIALPGSRG
jgi:thiazole synthase